MEKTQQSSTLKAIAAEIGLPESTLRVYRDQFAEFIPATGEGRRRRYGESGREALQKITGWKRQGWDSAAIREALLKEGRPLQKTRKRREEERWDEVAARLETQSQELTALRRETAALRQEIARLSDLLRQPAPSLEDILEMT